MVTRNDILDELRPIWSDITDFDFDLSAEMRIVQFLKDEGFWEIFDVADIRRLIGKYLCIEIPDYEWDGFWGAGVKAETWSAEVEPQITFGRLADLILAQLPDVSFEPIDICGRTCGPAGAFLGIRDVAAHTLDDVSRFAPSTPIDDCLQGNSLHRFWLQLQLLSSRAVPPLADPLGTLVRWLGFITIGSGLGFLFTLLLVAFVDLAEPLLFLFFPGFLLGAAAVTVVGVLDLIAGQYCLRPPKGIRTFRDLSEQLSAALSKRDNHVHNPA